MPLFWNQSSLLGKVFLMPRTLAVDPQRPTKNRVDFMAAAADAIAAEWRQHHFSRESSGRAAEKRAPADRCRLGRYAMAY
jgi:hypothetical protein